MAHRAGKAIRDEATMRAMYAEPCDNCGHQTGDHRELQRDLIALVDGEIVQTINPDYEPLVFHCQHDDCDCKQAAQA